MPTTFLGWFYHPIGGAGEEICPVSISGMEVGEVIEGHGTTCDCTLSVLFHIALFCMCVAG